MRWPPGWPIESYGLTPLRAAIVAGSHGRLWEFSRAAFARNFVHGLGLSEVADVLAVAAEGGGALADADIKRQLADATDAAIASGVVGVPTILASGHVFWGDDQVEAAAATMSEDLS